MASSSVVEQVILNHRSWVQFPPGHPYKGEIKNENDSKNEGFVR